MKKVISTEESLVSVIIPTYNREKLLPRAINSVLKQTYQQIELIIVDDGSIDNTEDVVKEFSDSRINYIRFKENRGQPTVLNEGIKASCGKYIVFLDDDDELLPSMLKTGINALRNTPNKIGFAVGLGMIIRNGKISLFNTEKYTKNVNILKAQLQFCALSLAGTIIKRTCFQKVGYLNEDLILGNDWEFMLRLIKKFDYISVNKILYKAHYDDSLNISHICYDPRKNLTLRLRIYGVILHEYYEDLAKYRGFLAKYYFRIAQILYYNKKFEKSRLFLRKAILQNPLNPRYIFYFVLTLFRNKLKILFALEQRIFDKMGKNVFSKNGLK